CVTVCVVHTSFFFFFVFFFFFSSRRRHTRFSRDWSSDVCSSDLSTLNLYGDLSITPKWKIQYNTGYDFQAQKITLTQFNIYRDLHCWDMSFGWIPFGTYRSYTFTLRIKASVLQDLKLTKRNDYYNSF